ncbi:MAG TPA: hypothetical protein VI670_19020 [Thermoanaerobaculia bacterium]|jgi:hypothetical protein
MASAKAITDHDEIRRWVEQRGGYPARVRGTGRGSDPGVLRIDYPGYSGEETLERIDWDEFFEWFDRDKLAMLAQGGKSRFSKFVKRGRATASKKRAASSKKTSAKRGAAASKKAASKKSPASKKAPAKRSASTKRAAPAKKRAAAKTTTNHNTIRKWVEKRGGYPARVKRTGRGSDPGVLRIDYPGYSGAGTLERIDWDEFFEWFDRDGLAFLYQDTPRSRFSKFVSR